MTEYDTEFVQETRSQVREISSELLELEDNPDNKETMDAIFRVAHTLKGSAGAMGFDLMSELAHAIEDVLDEVRAGELEVTSDLIDLLLEHGVDKIETQLSELEETGSIETRPEESLDELREKVPKKQEETSSSSKSEEPSTLETINVDEITSLVDEVEKPESTDDDVYYVRVLVSDKERSAVEAGEMSALGQLNDAFNVIGTKPNSTDIENGDYGDSFDAIVQTGIGYKNLEAALNGIELVEERRVKPATKYTGWTVDSQELEDQLDDSDIEDLNDAGVDVEKLLEEADEFSNIDDFDDSLVDGIELTEDFNEAEGGTFNATTVNQSEPEEDDEEDDTEIDNKGSRVFDELQEETEYTDDFDTIEEEMAEVGFDELDDDEMSFDELLDIEVDEDEEDVDDELVDTTDDEEANIFGNDDTEDEEEFEGIDISSDAEEEPVDDELDGIFGDVSEVTSDEEAESIFNSGFSPDEEEPESEESTLVTEENVDEEVDLGIDVGDQFDTGNSDDEDIGDIDAFGSAFDSSDSDGLSDFDELLREAGRTPASEQSSKKDEIQSIPVNVDQLDDLYSLMQEMITNRIRLRRAVEEGRNDPEALLQAINNLDDLEKVSTRMQDTIMDIRLVPLERGVDRLPRIARDVSRDKNKDVDFSMEGVDVELDRAVLTEISDPLMHLVRNAVDHGIELPEEREEKGKPSEGTVKLSAKRVRDSIHITIEDDGGGIDADAIRRKAVEKELFSEEKAKQLSDSQAYELIFRPGFTTADEVSETSGRGVGMDVVYSTIRNLDGSIDVESEIDKGTKVNLRVPVSLAIEEVLFINVGDESYGIPIHNVDETTYVENIKDVDGQEAHSHNGDIYPIIDLKETLGVNEADSNKGGERLIRVNDDVRKVALKCDGISGQEEIVVEPFDGVLSSIPGLSGATVLGEGNVINILDVETL